MASAIMFQAPNLQVFHFNRSNGKLSDAVNLKLPYPTCYGISFSPDSRKLYCSTVTDGGSVDTSCLYQFDVSGAWDSGTISATRKFLYGAINEEFGVLHIASDKKIYMANYRKAYFGIINAPNSSNCNYVHNGFYLNGKLSKFGLQNFLQDFLQLPTTAIETMPMPAGIEVYPNPVKSVTTIRINDSHFLGCTLTVYDAKGTIVYRQKTASVSNSFVRDGLPAGIYFLQVTGKNGEVEKGKFAITD